MTPPPEASPPPQDDKDQRFLEWAYWILGVFTAAWAYIVLVGIPRRLPFTIPFFGRVQLVEAIIFTQGAFCVLLPLLFAVIATFRGETARRG